MEAISISNLLLILAAIFFGLTINGHLQKINGVAAGLFCLTLLLLIENVTAVFGK